MIIRIFFILIISLYGNKSWSKNSKIQKVLFEKRQKDHHVIIHFNEKYNKKPDLKIYDNIIQISLNQVNIWPKVEQKLSVIEQYDTTLLAYQYNKTTSRVRLVLPKNIEKYRDNINIIFKEKKYILNFPKIGSTSSIQKKDKLDESYLKKLLEEENKKNTKLSLKKEVPNKIGKKKKDFNFSFNQQLIKFISFLVLVLLIFYLLVHVIKKVISKKGQIGILDNSKIVSIISTTYVGPKKSLMTVKVNNQVFLMSNTDQGIDLLTEIKETADILKEGEKAITGNNFDGKLSENINNESLDNNIKLKTDIQTSQPEVKKINFSDQIKKKVKRLRPLQ